MATLAQPPLAPAHGDERFFLRGAIAMAIVIVAGFSFQLAMGRSTFASPVRVHLHALLFMGWLGIYLLQNIFVASGRLHLHRKLGWVAAVWMVPMVVSGFYITIVMTRAGVVPFFFRPLQFLVFDPVAVLTFAGLTTTAIVMRKRTEWHRRLHFCAMTMLLAPGFGRLLPLPLLQPWAWEAAFAAGLLFPIAGATLDARRRGSVHPAWKWGIATILASFVLVEALTYSAAGRSLYFAVTEGHPGASKPPLSFATQEGRLMTGRS